MTIERALMGQIDNSPIDPYFSNVYLLLNANDPDTFNSFKDRSLRNHTIAASSTARSNTDVYGLPGGSLYFYGATNSYIQIAQISNDLRLGSAAFCLEFWMKPLKVSGENQVLNTASWVDPTAPTPSPGAVPNCSYAIVIIDGVLKYYLSGTGTTWDIADGLTIGSVSVGSWYHVRLQRYTDFFSSALNGISGASTTSYAALYNFTSPLALGVWYNRPFFGHIDELRLTKNTVRYGAGDPAPTGPFPMR